MTSGVRSWLAATPTDNYKARADRALLPGRKQTPCHRHPLLVEKDVGRGGGGDFPARLANDE